MAGTITFMEAAAKHEPHQNPTVHTPADVARWLSSSLTAYWVTRQKHPEGNIFERTQLGRVARRLGVIGVVTTTTMLAGTVAKAYVGFRHGIDLDVQVPNVPHTDNLMFTTGPLEVDEGGRSSAPKNAPHIEADGARANNEVTTTIAGRTIDTNDYVLGDNTRYVESGETLTNLAKDDLAIAASSLGIEESKIDDLYNNYNAAAYVVDGYADDTGNAGDINLNDLSVTPGADLETDEARARAMIAAQWFYDQERGVMADRREVPEVIDHDDSARFITVAGVEIDHADYDGSLRLAQDWHTTRDSAWTWAEQDLARAGWAHGWSEAQIEGLLTTHNIDAVKDTYTQIEPISRHPKHYLLEGVTYDTTAARAHADKIVEQYRTELMGGNVKFVPAADGDLDPGNARTDIPPEGRGRWPVPNTELPPIEDEDKVPETNPPATTEPPVPPTSSETLPPPAPPGGGSDAPEGYAPQTPQTPEQKVLGYLILAGLIALAAIGWLYNRRQRQRTVVLEDGTVIETDAPWTERRERPILSLPAGAPVAVEQRVYPEWAAPEPVAKERRTFVAPSSADDPRGIDIVAAPPRRSDIKP